MKRITALLMALALSLTLAPAALGAERALPDQSAYPELQVNWMPGYELPPYYGVSSTGKVVAVDPATGLMGVLDVTGKVVVPCTYENLRGYTSRRDFIEIMGTRSGPRYLDRNGGALDAAYDFIPDFIGGLSPVTDPETGLTGYLNQDFELAIPCLYEGNDYFLEDGGGFVVAYREGVGSGLLDKQGGFTIPQGWDGVEAQSRDSRYLVVTKGEAKAVIRRETGEVVIPPGTYDHIVPQWGEGGGFFQVYRKVGESLYDALVGVVDLEGNVVVPVQYSDARVWEADYIYSGTCFLVEDEGGWGLLDAAGKELLPCQYNLDMIAHMGPSGPSIYDVLHELHPEVPEYVYAQPVTYQDGLTSYSETGEDGVERWGFRDEAGNQVTPAIFDSVGDCMFRGWCTVSKDGVYGLLKNPLFRDTVSDWAEDEVEAAREKGLVTDRNQTYMTYPITRLQFAELAVNLLERTTGQSLHYAAADRFTDTTDGVARKAAAAGIVSGTGDGSTFSPDDFITREQLSAMLYRAMTAIARAQGRMDAAPAADLSGYTDAAAVSEWAKTPVSALLSNRILKGTSEKTLSPQDNTTVEQAVLMVLRASGTEGEQEPEVRWFPGYDLTWSGVSSGGVLVARDKATGKYGILDLQGNVVVPCTYETRIFGYDAWTDRAEIDKEMGEPLRYFDPNGKLVESPYSAIGPFSMGLALAVDAKTGKCGFVDESYRAVIPCVYDYDYSDYRFEEENGGRLVISKDGVSGILDRDGTFTVPKGLDGVASVSAAGRRVVAYHEDAAGKQTAALLDETGKVLIPEGTYTHISPYQHGLAEVLVGEDYESGFCGAVDLEGKVVVPLEFYVVDIREEGPQEGVAVFVCRRDVGWGMLDAQGKELLPCVYNFEPGEPRGNSYDPPMEKMYKALDPDWTWPDSTEYEDGLAHFVTSAGKIGFQDEAGNIVIPAVFDAKGGGFCRGWCALEKDGVWGLVRNPLYEREA